MKMFDIRRIPENELTALRFKDREEFRKAVRIAAEADIPADAPGMQTLIIRKLNRSLFSRFEYLEQKVGTRK